MGGEALGLTGVVGDVIDADRDLLDGRGGGAERLGLMLRLGREGAGHAREVVDAAVELGRVIPDLEEHGAQGRDEAVEGLGGLADLVAGGDRQLAGEVPLAAGDLGQRIAQAKEVLEQAGEGEVGGDGAEGGDEDPGEDQRPEQGGERGEDRGLVDDGGEGPVGAGDRGDGDVLGAAVDGHLAQGDGVAGVLEGGGVEAGHDLGDGLQG